MRISDADREQVAQVLHAAMSEGRITINELEERLTIVYAAKTVGDLKPVTADLPQTRSAIQPATSRALGLPDDRIGGHPGSGASIAIMSGASRKGSWVVPPQHNSFAFWGGTDIDLRHARFAEKNTTITAVAIMGGIDIVVPDDINVDVTGIGFMGAFELEDRAGTPAAPPTAPTVKITGLAFWGAVTVVRKSRKKDTPELEG
ncbi:DUF1707 domain-containing protein [Amycolatopsis sp. BJA-103]|uniref:DUF1707 SHOCT-like domain-containing protein n=1 Tax=Amycolatopsis sp. BJA-103 TaxID=1911175 RepID=UPI000C790A30|nr:DUF1707 domain-containing protein [Amycolatopsis sp. BJA-103]AUI63474.1 hypothetical protein BKN51_38545 [Amycolatopsis sp. BJA-103]PNE19321.1 hypothetical protein B1H26_16260 [Amycolatopsis sp. BJA-103]